MSPVPQNAIVLAAGLGLRMRPLTEKKPKPLIKIAGKALLDWGLDALAAAGVETAVVNVHHLAGQIVAHAARRAAPRVVISDETDKLLDSGGAIVKALPLLGSAPFLIVNADTFWIDRGASNLERLALAWDAARMDILLMLVEPNSATGHSGTTDFIMDPRGRLLRAKADPAGLIYAGAAMAQPRIFAEAEAAPASLNRWFDQAISAGRLYGMRMQGRWITVGAPEAIATAEEAVAAELAL